MAGNVPLVYMDLCTIKRPLDEPREGRVILEADAAVAIALACDGGRVRLVQSSALEAENDLNPDPVRRERARAAMARWPERATVTPAASHRARELVGFGFGPGDALHVAVAEDLGASVLVTTDDRFLRAAKRVPLRVRVVNPVVFAMELSREGH